MKVYGQLEKSQLESLASDPASPPTGYIYFNTTSNRFKIYNGSTWKDVENDLTTHEADTSTHGVAGAVVGTTDTQVLTNKDIDGGTASNTSRITIPKDTLTNLQALTRKEGTIVYATDTDKFYSDNGTLLVEVGSGVTGIAPVGSIVAFVGGYFGNSSNGSFTNVLGNTIANVNAYANSNGFYVCDGSALNDPSSPIFNGANRYLPNLTDSRFLMGSTASGTAGGAASVTLSSANLPTHTHVIDHTHGSSSISGTANTENVYTPAGSTQISVLNGGTLTGGVYAAGGNAFRYVNCSDGGAHSHSLSGTAAGQTFSGSSGNGGFANSAFSILPTYLSTIYIMRVR